jgi:hypothetical protein
VEKDDEGALDGSFVNYVFAALTRVAGRMSPKSRVIEK